MLFFEAVSSRPRGFAGFAQPLLARFGDRRRASGNVGAIRRDLKFDRLETEKAVDELPKTT